MKFRFLISILLFAAWIHADPFISDSSFETTSVKSLPAPPALEKNDATAYAWALGGGILLPALGLGILDIGSHGSENAYAQKTIQTLGGVMIAYGLGIGSSMGEFYAGSYSAGILTTSGRSIGAALFAIGALQNSFSCGFIHFDVDDDNTDECSDSEPGTPLIVVGSLIFAASEIYSLIDTHYAVQRANEKSKPPHFGFAPELFRSSNGGLKPGVMAWTKF